MSAALGTTPPNTAQADSLAAEARRWAELEPWLDRALDQPCAAREAWLAAQPLEQALRQELQALLAAERESRAGLGPQGDEARQRPEAAAPPALAEGERVGAWQVESLIGRGGSGEVYRVARADGSYEQKAALKLLRAADDPEERRQFSAERRLLARLQSPAIVRLLDGGAHGGRLYAVTELVEGVPLDEHAAALPLAGRIALLRRVVAAVAEAHRAGVIHRDLKPANVLVDAQGMPRLLDFGIAKLAEGPADVDATLTLRFTPDWCAPEQLQAQPVNAAADVFALGVMAYQLLAECLPWQLQGHGFQRAVQRLGSGTAPLPPSRHLAQPDARQVRGDLDAIVLRCLRHEPSARYAHAGALLEELERWQDGRPVHARGDAPGYLLGRLLRRHRLLVAAACVALFSLVAGLAGVGWQALVAARERDTARAEAAVNKAVRDALLTMFRDAATGAAAAAPAVVSADGQPGAAAANAAPAPDARTLLARSAARLAAELQADPAAADTLLALAQLYFQLNDYAGATPLFERLLALADLLPPETVAQARMDLAQCLWRSGQAERAAAELAQAQAFWQAEPARWRHRLLESRPVQAQLLRARGDLPGAIKVLSAALAEREALLGSTHADTALLVNDLAIAHYHAGHLAQARAGFERAWAAWQALGAAHGPDALNTLNNWAALALREGRAEEAEALFRQALALRRAHLPPSAAQAALMNNLGKLMLRRGDAAGALPLLSEAATMASRFAGPASPHAMAALAGLAEAHAALGQGAAARASLQQMDQRVQALQDSRDPQRAAPDLAWARWHATRREWREAHARLAAAREHWQALGPAGAPYLAQVRDLASQWPAP